MSMARIGVNAEKKKPIRYTAYMESSMTSPYASAPTKFRLVEDCTFFEDKDFEKHMAWRFSNGDFGDAEHISFIVLKNGNVLGAQTLNVSQQLAQTAWT